MLEILNGWGDTSVSPSSMMFNTCKRRQRNRSKKGTHHHTGFNNRGSDRMESEQATRRSNDGHTVNKSGRNNGVMLPRIYRY